MIQSRYGWTDDQVLSLPYARFREILDIVIKAREREQRDRMVEAAFVGWQGYLGWPKGKGKQPMTFQKWLSSMGLVDRQKAPSAVERERTIQRARETAERVAEVFG